MNLADGLGRYSYFILNLTIFRAAYSSRIGSGGCLEAGTGIEDVLLYRYLNGKAVYSAFILTLYRVLCSVPTRQ
jgi:hypothetical protein